MVFLSLMSYQNVLLSLESCALFRKGALVGSYGRRRLRCTRDLAWASACCLYPTPQPGFRRVSLSPSVLRTSQLNLATSLQRYNNSYYTATRRHWQQHWLDECVGRPSWHALTYCLATYLNCGVLASCYCFLVCRLTSFGRTVASLACCLCFLVRRAVNMQFLLHLGSFCT